jgi:TrmH family RNA methyltransferase
MNRVVLISRDGCHLCHDAELVLEGYFDERGHVEPEGPYGEFLGYYGALKRNPVFHLTAITKRHDALFQSISALESPARMGFVLPLPPAPALDPGAATVVLDRLQDTGNVGAILRCASAFGFRQVLALKGSAALWSPKVLRAGMGAHFGLHLVEGLSPDALDALDIPWVATSSHQGPFLHTLLAQAKLPMPCAWLMGHEGQGVSPELAQRAELAVRIAQPGGEESLNVAAAAAICLHASATCHWVD